MIINFENILKRKCFRSTQNLRKNTEKFNDINQDFNMISFVNRKSQIRYFVMFEKKIF